MKLEFDYRMNLYYSSPVSKCHFTIKCIPKDTARQKLLSHTIELTPHAPFSVGEDSNENKQIYGRVDTPHDFFSYHIFGDVEIYASDFEEIAKEGRVSLYRYPFGKCIPKEALTAYFSTFDLSGFSDDIDKSLYIMHKLHSDFSYVPKTTEVTTDAETSFKMGVGVCQDYAHILITLLRLSKIPARYVCGLLVGEGESHAWVEALVGDKWIGLDPTHDCRVYENYIKLGDGRDATECAINRGILRGGGAQRQEISSKVTSPTLISQ